MKLNLVLIDEKTEIEHHKWLSVKDDLYSSIDRYREVAHKLLDELLDISETNSKNEENI